MRDNIFLILFCVFFIILDTLILGYSIGRIYPPIPAIASTQASVPSSSVRKEKQQELSEEQEENSQEETVDTTSQQQENSQEENADTTNQQQEDLVEEKQEISVAEQVQNLQNEQQTAIVIEEPIIEPEIPYTYTREEINNMLIIGDGRLLLQSDTFEGETDEDDVTDTDMIINGETCYMGMAYTGVAWSEAIPYDDRAGFFIGNQSLKVYNESKEYIGMATENFLPALAKENQSHLQ